MEIPDFDVQIRDEEGNLEYFPTLKEAFKKAETDLGVWKVSFTAPSGERVRLVKREVVGAEDSVTEVVWVYESLTDALERAELKRRNA